MSDESQNSADRYAGMDPTTVEAFNRWHKFNDDLLTLGDFVAWLSDADNQAELVTFFMMDQSNIKSYQDGLQYQIDLLLGVRQMLESTQSTMNDLLSKRAE